MKFSIRRLTPALGAFAVLLAPGLANAAFEARSLDANPADSEAWYDTASGLTWLRDVGANAAAAGLFPSSTVTSSYSAASLWAEGLNFGGSSDWRIPTLSESVDLNTKGFLAPSYFDGLGSGTGPLWNQAFMWTSTALTPGVSQYLLRVSGSPQGAVDGAIYDRGFQVFAVATGSLGVPLSPVPEPSAYALAGLGLIGLALVRRQKRR